MAQILDPLPSGISSAYLLCCYVNATGKIQVARITDIPNWYFERVVFPGQRLVFEAPAQSHLEIHSGLMASAILSDTIPCDRLTIQEELANTWAQNLTNEVYIPEHERIPLTADSSSFAEIL